MSLHLPGLLAAALVLTSGPVVLAQQDASLVVIDLRGDAASAALGHLSWPVGTHLDPVAAGPWLPAQAEPATDALRQAVDKASAPFFAGDPAASVKPLTFVVEADRGPARNLRDPATAAIWFEAHLLLWWSMRQSKADPASMEAVINLTAARFPAAQVTTSMFPPYVVQALEQAKLQIAEGGASLQLSIPPSPSECTFFINGSRSADDALAVAPDVTLYVRSHCPHAVVDRTVKVSANTSNAIDLRLDTALEHDRGTVRFVAPPANIKALVSALARQVGAGRVVTVESSAGRPHLGIWDGAGNQLKAVSVDVHGMQVAIDELLAESATARVDSPPKARSFLWTSMAVGLTAASLVGALTTEWLVVSRQDELDACLTADRCLGTAEVRSRRTSLSDAATLRTWFYGGAGLAAAAALVAFSLEADWFGADNKVVVAPSPWDGGWRMTLRAEY